MKKIIIILLVLCNSAVFAGYIPGLIVKGRLKSSDKYILLTNSSSVNIDITICSPELYSELLIISSDGSYTFDPYTNEVIYYNPLKSNFSTGEYTDSLRLKNIQNVSGSCRAEGLYYDFTYKITVFDYKSSDSDTIIQLPKCGKSVEIKNNFKGDYIGSWQPELNCSACGFYTYGNLLKIENPYNITKDTIVYFNVRSLDGSCTSGRKFIIKPAYKVGFNESICMVTNINNKNDVIWANNKTLDIKSFRIYKQSKLSSNYELVHEQSSSLLSEWIDTTSKPNSQIERYKLAIVDSCGVEFLSSNHTTILLSSNMGINGTVNLSWNAYEGFNYSNFEIWRSTDGTNFNLLSSTANNTFSYIDNNPPVTGYYQIRIANLKNCTPDKRSFSYVNSNTVDKSGKSVAAISALTLDKNDFITGYFDLLGRTVEPTIKNQIFIVQYASGKTEKSYVIE